MIISETQATSFNQQPERLLPLVFLKDFIKIQVVLFSFESSVYPKVKVRQEQYQEDHQNIQDSNLKDLQSLALRVSRSPVRNQKDGSQPSTAEVPKCYVPCAPIPRVPVSEDLGVCNLTSDSSGPTGPEKDDNIDEDKVNIRASSIPRPRAVLSSPDNDTMFGNRNRIKGQRLPASKNYTVLQNRHALCKVKSSNITEDPPNMRKPKEAAEKSSNITDSIQKRRPKKSASNQNTSRGTGRSGSVGL